MLASETRWRNRCERSKRQPASDNSRFSSGVKLPPISDHDDERQRICGQKAQREPRDYSFVIRRDGVNNSQCGLAAAGRIGGFTHLRQTRPRRRTPDADDLRRFTLPAKRRTEHLQRRRITDALEAAPEIG